MSQINYSKPFRVMVKIDCRRDAKQKLDGCYGICLGLYDPYTGKRDPEGNPLILSHKQYIWGYECWWREAEELGDLLVW